MSSWSLASVSWNWWASVLCLASSPLLPNTGELLEPGLCQLELVGQQPLPGLPSPLPNTWVTWLLIFIGPGGSALKMLLASVASARKVASVKKVF